MIGTAGDLIGPACMSVVEGSRIGSGAVEEDSAASAGSQSRRCFPQATLLLLLGGIAVPNALAVAANIWVDVPPRSAAIAAYAAVTFLSARLHAAVLVPLYLAAVAFDGLGIVAHVFFMDLTLVTETIPAFTHVRVFTSPFYAGLIAAVTIVLAGNILFLLRCRSAMARGNRLVFLLALLGCVGADIQIGSASRATQGPAAGIGQPFESAVRMSGFSETADSARPKRNVLLVLVESLGILRDPQHRNILFSAFDDADLRARFTLTSGTTTFFGATAYGEMRELCQSRSPYRVILHGSGPDCLPGAYAARGYRTVSVHGFSGEFYERDQWYAKIGFARSVFPETATTSYARRCGDPFIGPCDVEVADTISDRLANASQPMFIYWVTLNSHVPVRAGEATPRHGCATGGPFGDPEVCAMAEIWQDLFEAITRLAKRNPETEILLVGDHAPPLWRRAARGLFEPDRVPWLRLAPRGPLAAAGDWAAPSRACAACGRD